MTKIKILLLVIPFVVFQFIIPVNQASYELWSTETIIAHATGSIDGITYTNSKEAILESHRNGVNIMEIDIKYTSDGEIVLIHNWSDINIKENPTHQEFMDFKIHGKYTTLDIRSLARLMGIHRDIIITLDSKEKDTVKLYHDVFTILDKEYSYLADRFVPIIYDFSEYDSLEKVARENYNYIRIRNYMYGFYKKGSKLYTNAKEFLERMYVREKVTALLTSFEEVEFNKEVRRFDTQIPMYYHTVNSREYLDIVLNDLQGTGVSTDLKW